MRQGAICTLGLMGLLWQLPASAAEPAAATAPTATSPASAAAAPAADSPATPTASAPAPAPTTGPAQAPMAAPGAAPAPVYAPSPYGTPPPVVYQHPQTGQYVAVAPPGYVLVPVAGPAQPPPPPPPRGPRPSDRNHDGFYLRLSLGPGYYWDSLKSSPDNGADESLYGSLLSLDVLVGGTVAPGFILGGGLWLKPALNIHYENDSTSPELADNSDLVFVQVGPFVDYYFDSKQGLHVQAAFAFSTLNLSYNSYDSDGFYNSGSLDANGFAVMGGIGYDFWIGRSWSAGILGNLSYSSLEGDSGYSADYSHRIWSPSVVATFTLN